MSTLTGNPEISEYFFAGLKLGGALMELSEIQNETIGTCFSLSR